MGTREDTVNPWTGSGFYGWQAGEAALGWAPVPDVPRQPRPNHPVRSGPDPRVGRRRLLMRTLIP